MTQKKTEASTNDSWRIMAQDPKYSGNGFCELQSEPPDRDGNGGRPLHPNPSQGGSYLRPLANETNAFIARFTRCVTNHAPIGSYYLRFGIDEDTHCTCGCLLTRDHILHSLWWQGCDKWQSHDHRTGSLPGLVRYLKENPMAFAFSNDRQQLVQQPPQGVG